MGCVSHINHMGRLGGAVRACRELGPGDGGEEGLYMCALQQSLSYASVCVDRLAPR